VSGPVGPGGGGSVKVGMCSQRESLGRANGTYWLSLIGWSVPKYSVRVHHEELSGNCLRSERPLCGVWETPSTRFLLYKWTTLQVQVHHLGRMRALMPASYRRRARMLTYATTSLPNLDMLSSSLPRVIAMRGILGSTSDCLPAEVGGV
jgi:hypothetical protein